MALLKAIEQFGLKLGKLATSKYGRVPVGIGIGYAAIPKNRKPHPITDIRQSVSYMASGSPDLLGGLGTFMNWDVIRPGIGTALWPNAQYPKMQVAFSAMAHENLNARYGGPNPNSDSALFTNNFDNTTGQYIGPRIQSATNSSLGYLSSRMNVAPNANIVFGLYNNRLSGVF